MLLNTKGSSIITFLGTFLFLVIIATTSVYIASANAILSVNEVEQYHHLYEQELETSSEFSALLNSDLSYNEMCTYFDNNYGAKYYFEAKIMETGDLIHSCGSPPGDVNYFEETAFSPSEEKNKIRVLLQTW